MQGEAQSLSVLYHISIYMYMQVEGVDWYKHRYIPEEGGHDGTV